MKKSIAIVGRPNVGKSTLFNRLSRKNRAIIDDVPGVTRDRNYADVQWNDLLFTLIDTGGFEADSKQQMVRLVHNQALTAIEEADIILFLTDGKDSLTPVDLDLVNLLRTVAKPVFYCINKVDGPRHEDSLYDFYQTGIDRWFQISAQHSRGVDELMDAVAALLPEQTISPEEENLTKVAVLGRPNVGKSSLVNRILGVDRVIVDETPGTTRDAIDTPLTFNRQKYLIIDTAGIRRKSRIDESLEKYSVTASLRAISRCDVGLIILDAHQGITEQDVKIAGQVYNRGKACMLVVNKWDLVEKDNSTVGQYVTIIKTTMKFLDFAPILFVSALSGQRVPTLLEKATDCVTQFQKRVPTSDLNNTVERIMRKHPPPHFHGKEVKFYYASQVDTGPPTFAFFTNRPEAIHFSYERHVENQLREAYGFEGTPLRIFFRGKNRRAGKSGKAVS
ncbi:MAG: ribosome biogenesis GTPase Der [Deltaproteobacteria bacterium]|nr:ribosome biogenesis GTPase Der [Deltaproteobacteria bacterium]